MLHSLITLQWPFWLGGLFVGLAEIVFYYHYDMFIVVTTGFAQMFAVTEKQFFNIDWVGRIYELGVYWFILFAVLGARMVVVGEKESRAWVKYDGRMLLLAFIGGPLLGMGAVLMIGCEVRTYARLGLGYSTALAALPGFYLVRFLFSDKLLVIVLVGLKQVGRLFIHCY